VRTRRFEYAKHIWHGWNDARLVNSLRRFCKKHDALLVVKSRIKTPIPTYLQRAADVVVFDDSYYPASILQVLSVASLCVSFCSGAVIEAAASSVPHLALTFSEEDYFKNSGNAKEQIMFREFYKLDEGTLFQFARVSKAIPIPTAIDALPELALDDFALDPSARLQYLRRYAGGDDGRSSARLLEQVAAVRADRR
jgi:hypothetical protein